MEISTVVPSNCRTWHWTCTLSKENLQFEVRLKWFGSPMAFLSQRILNVWIALRFFFAMVFSILCSNDLRGCTSHQRPSQRRRRWSGSNALGDSFHRQGTAANGEVIFFLYGYGSIPIDTIFSGMNIHKSQLFWCELQGYKVLTHCHFFPRIKTLKLDC